MSGEGEIAPTITKRQQGKDGTANTGVYSAGIVV